MGSWNDLLDEFQSLPENVETRSDWLKDNLKQSLSDIRILRDDSNVLFYASAFLQKPQASAPALQLSGEELNALMAVIYGMDFNKPLTLLLHTPGGITNAAETFVAYLREKFPKIFAIIPGFAMSAGTMIALGSNRIVMGRQSQLGPIDPQMQIPATGRFVSARAIVDQFVEAKKEITKDAKTAHAWAPILQSLGPALLQEARNALDYGEEMVARWLAEYMFKGQDDASDKAEAAAHYFNDAAKHKSHGRRIDRKEARSVEILIDDLEDDQDLQEAVLTAYHLVTIVFEQTQASKIVFGDNDRSWVKNLATPGAQQTQPGGNGPPSAPRPQTRQQRRKDERERAQRQKK